MAVFFPDLNNISRLRVTPEDGEKFLLNYLSSNLDDTFEVFFNPYLDGDRPDVVVLKKGCGAQIIEVKDWNLINYRIDYKNDWTVLTDKAQKIKSPNQQVFRYKKNMFDLHLPILGLEHALDNKLFRVIKAFVYYHKTDTQQLKELYSPSSQDLRAKINNNNNEYRAGELAQLKYTNTADYLNKKRDNLDRDLAMSITSDSIDNKIAKIKLISKDALFTDEIYEDFKRRLSPPSHVLQQGIAIPLDKKQTSLSESKSGLYKIKGVAGCGKTSILTQRAVNAYDRHHSDVLILTYNVTLNPYIKDQLSKLLGKSQPEFIEVTNYHRFFNAQLNDNNIDTKKILDDLIGKGQTEKKALEQLYQTDVFLNHLTKKYQTILIDEIQDYDTEWVKIIRDNFLASDGEMVLFGDQAQNIYNRDEKKRESSIAVGFGRWEVLTRSYRSQLDTPLINLFKEFQEQYLASKYKDIDVFESLYISRQNSLSLDILEYEKYSQPIDLNIITKQINNKIKNNKLIPNDITIICSKIDVLIEINKILNEHERTMTMFESKEEKNSLLQTFKAKEPDFKITEENKVLYDKAIKQIRNIKKNFFMQNSGLIKLSTTHSFKGRESQTVFCILLKEDDPELIYTVLTRAKINLFIFDVVDSQYGDFFRRLITTSLTHQHEPSQP